VIHPLSDVQSLSIGEDTNIWQFCVVLNNAVIGSNCSVQIWDGIEIEDNVQIGPNVSFSNDRYPKAKNKNFKLERTIVKSGASIGANATILPGITIGENALIGAGSVVTKDVKPNTIVMGNPAREKPQSRRPKEPK